MTKRIVSSLPPLVLMFYTFFAASGCEELEPDVWTGSSQPTANVSVNFITLII